MSRSRQALIAAAIVLVAPSAARGAALTTDLPCYVEGQPMTVSGSGWAQSSTFGLAGARIAATGTASFAGAWSADVTAPRWKGRSTTPRRQVLTGTQDGAPVAAASFRTIDFAVEQRSRPGDRPATRRLARLSGFQPGRRVYLHVRRQGTRRAYTRLVGTPEAPCGTLRRRLPRLPAVPKASIRYGSYIVAFDNRRRYSATTSPQATITVRIIRGTA